MASTPMLIGFALAVALPSLVRAENTFRSPAIELEPTIESAANKRFRRNKDGLSTVSIAFLLKDLVSTRSGEICESYGADKDCLEEVEVCLSLRSPDDDVVRLCLHSEPGERDKSRSRSASRKR